MSYLGDVGTATIGCPVERQLDVLPAARNA